MPELACQVVLEGKRPPRPSNSEDLSVGAVLGKGHFFTAGGKLGGASPRSGSGMLDGGRH